MIKHLYNTVGTVKRHPDGFGFLIPDNTEEKDVYLPKHTMEGIMTNDKVEVKVYNDSKSKKDVYGDIIKVVQRSKQNIVGIYHNLNDDYGLIVDKENHWGMNLHIPIQQNMGAKEKEWVRCEVITYPGHPKGFTAKIVEIIGHCDDPAFDVKRAIAINGIPEEFNKNTLREVQSLDPEVDLTGTEYRRDLRSKNFVTIDGVTAKDFDDAVYVETRREGFKLWVAIADVSHYVKPGSSLDDDAYDRGNSSYFPMYVVPMLPEILSNELCSLKPNVNRLAMVAEMLIDFRGELQDAEFYEAIIESKSRVTYGEAQEIIDGESIKKHKHVEMDIQRASDLAKILMAKRYGAGALDLEVPETEVILDESGTPVDIIRSERVFAHKVIEELMLIANVAVARFIGGHDDEVQGIYRTHEEPNEEKLKILENFLKTFGTQTTLAGNKLQKRITKALKKYSDRPEGQILNTLTLRSMKQAKYTVENVGHFGLNFDYYTHFTSPIRRYPDLVIHRILKHLVYGKKLNYSVFSSHELDSTVVHCSATEQRSVKAERFVTAVKKARFASKLIGEELEGTITSVTRFGIFVSLRQYDIEGLVRVFDLGNDHFKFNEETLELTGDRSGYIYKMGMPVNVVVAACNSELGQIDFNLVSEAFTPSKKKKLKPKKAKKEDSNSSSKHNKKSKDKKTKSKSKSHSKKGIVKKSKDKKFQSKKKKKSR